MAGTLHARPHGPYATARPISQRVRPIPNDVGAW